MHHSCKGCNKKKGSFPLPHHKQLAAKKIRFFFPASPLPPLPPVSRDIFLSFSVQSCSFSGGRLVVAVKCLHVCTHTLGWEGRRKGREGGKNVVHKSFPSPKLILRRGPSPPSLSYFLLLLLLLRRCKKRAFLIFAASFSFFSPGTLVYPAFSSKGARQSRERRGGRGGGGEEGGGGSIVCSTYVILLLGFFSPPLSFSSSPSYLLRPPNKVDVVATVLDFVCQMCLT